MVSVGYFVIVALTPYPADIRVMLFVTYTNPFKNISLSFTKVSYVDELRLHRSSAIANWGFINNLYLVPHQLPSFALTLGAIE